MLDGTLDDPGRPGARRPGFWQVTSGGIMLAPFWPVPLRAQAAGTGVSVPAAAAGARRTAGRDGHRHPARRWRPQRRDLRAGRAQVPPEIRDGRP